MASIRLVLLRDVIQALALHDGYIDDPAGRRRRAARLTRRQILPRFLQERVTGLFRHFDRQIQIRFVVLFAGAAADCRVGRRRLARQRETTIPTQLVRLGQRQLRLDVATHDGRDQRWCGQRRLEELVAYGSPLLGDQALLFGQSEPTGNVRSWNAGTEERRATEWRCPGLPGLAKMLYKDKISEM